MASTTKPIVLTPAWQDIAQGNIYLYVSTLDAGRAEIWYGAAAPTVANNGQGVVLGSQGLSIEVGGTDVVYARVTDRQSMTITVMQRTA